MEGILKNVSIQVNDCIYLKNPDSSDLGKKIINGSIDLIDQIGFDTFTFRKLALEISSTEASIYRYFESKHKLLLYLTSWYWVWMEYRLVLGTANIESAKDRLEKAIRLLTELSIEENEVLQINVTKLNRIVISESSKAYLTKEVDTENQEGVFLGYKQLVARVSDIIKEINPGYKYPNMLVSTVMEGAHHQRFFAQHLPRLTNVIKGEDSISKFYIDLVFHAILIGDHNTR